MNGLPYPAGFLAISLFGVALGAAGGVFQGSLWRKLRSRGCPVLGLITALVAMWYIGAVASRFWHGNGWLVGFIGFGFYWWAEKSGATMLAFLERTKQPTSQTDEASAAPADASEVTEQMSDVGIPDATSDDTQIAAAEESSSETEVIATVEPKQRKTAVIVAVTGGLIFAVLNVLCGLAIRPDLRSLLLSISLMSLFGTAFVIGVLWFCISAMAAIMMALNGLAHVIGQSIVWLARPVSRLAAFWSWTRKTLEVSGECFGDLLPCGRSKRSAE